MRSTSFTVLPEVLAVLMSAFTAAASAQPAEVQAPGAPGAQPSAKAKRGPFRVVHEAEAVFVPAQATELSIAPLAYEGELRVAEVAPHGARVRQGDVILRLEEEKLEDQIQLADWAVRASARALADARAKHEELASDSEREVARAEKDLAFAEKGLKAYFDVSRPLEKAEYESSDRYLKHQIEDQEDELAQLGKMYKEDQLTEETEEIVLKRAKRNLEETKNRRDLSTRRHAFQEEYTEPVEAERVENSVKDKRKGLKDLRRARETAAEMAQIDLEKLEHDAAVSKRRAERLRQDREHLVFRAPHDGIVIHGAIEEKVAVNVLRRASMVAPHVPIITVARTGPLKVRFSVKEKDRYRLGAGLPVSILPEALPDRRLAGSLEPIAGFPLPDNTWNANVVFGHDDERLLPLLKAKVVVVLHEGIDSLTVPVGAVFRKNDRAVCYVRGKSPFGILARTVVPGPDNGKDILIRDGLSEGDEVLLEEPPQ